MCVQAATHAAADLLRGDLPKKATHLDFSRDTHTHMRHSAPPTVAGSPCRSPRSILVLGKQRVVDHVLLDAAQPFAGATAGEVSRGQHQLLVDELATLEVVERC